MTKSERERALSVKIDDMVAKAELVCMYGENSFIYKLGTTAIKKYFDLDLDQLLFYQKLTNNSSVAFNQKINTASGLVVVDIVRINDVVESARDFSLYTLSKFQSGDNLHEYIESGKIDKNLKSTIDDILYNTSVGIVESQDVRGVNIIPWNVIIKSEGEKKHYLKITDLCPRIQELKADKD